MALRPASPVGGGSSGTDSYSANEVLTNKVWTNGKPIYRKVIDCGALPNASSKFIAHNLSGVAFVNVYGLADEGNGNYYPMPTTHPSGIQHTMALQVLGASVLITTAINLSSRTGIAVLEYTK